MNTKQRFLNAMNRQPVDRPPVASVVTAVTVGMMDRIGIHWPQAHSDADQLATLAASVWEQSRIECIKLPFDMNVEIEAIGAPIDYGTVDILPMEEMNLYDDPVQLVIPDDWMNRGRVPLVLDAIGQLRKRYDNEVAIVTSIVGPFSMAGKLFGFGNFFIWLVENPEYVHQIMDQLNNLAIQYARMQVDAGADTITIGEASCSGDLVSPQVYEEFIMPYHQKLCPSIPVPNLLHICGKSTRHLPYIAQTGATAYNFDEGVDIHKARESMQGKMTLIGYVPTIKGFLDGTPDEVYQMSMQCLENGVDILAPGCSMPPHSTFENIAAMVRAAEDWGKRK